MKLLVSGATRTLQRYAGHPHLGHLLTPHNGNRLEALLATGMPIGVDNACFGGLDEAAFVRLLERLMPVVAVHRERFLWCCVPDVVADARATLRQFGRYASLVGWAGLPPAFVAQDGCTVLSVPWEAIRCLFIGGSTSWKEGPEAARLVVEAKRRGKLVHVGRVNSLRRLAPFEALGADSFDGGQFSRFPDTYIPRWLERLERRQRGAMDLLTA